MALDLTSSPSSFASLGRDWRSQRPERIRCNVEQWPGEIVGAYTFGAFSNRIDRKLVMMTGNLIAALTTIPIYSLMWGFPPAGGKYQPVALVLLVFVLVLYGPMDNEPIASFLVESC